MKILLLCNKSPWPPREGGPIAMHAIVSGLIRAGHEVKILAANTNKYHVNPGEVPGSYRKATGIEFVNINLRIKPFGALLNLLSGTSFHVSRFFTRAFRNKLIEILSDEHYDIIQCEMLYMTAYLDVIRKHSKAPVILRAHNIEHLIWERIAGNEKNLLKKKYLKHLVLTLRDYEQSVLPRLNGIAAITATDAEYFRQHAGKVPVAAIPFGIEPSGYPEPSPLPGKMTLFSIGSMNWLPNIEGIKWFLEKVWPRVHEKAPDLNFHIAGREMPDWLRNASLPGVTVEGEVPDAQAFMQQHAVMVAPIFSGSGIRIKIIEAMAAGRAVVSTTIGAEGIGYTDGKNIVIADNADNFTAAVLSLFNDPAQRQSLGAEARKLVIEEHNNDILIRDLTALYSRALEAASR